MLSLCVEISNAAYAQKDFFKGRFQFVNINMPAVIMVGQNFTLTGKLVNVAGALDAPDQEITSGDYLTSGI